MSDWDKKAREIVDACVDSERPCDIIAAALIAAEAEGRKASEGVKQDNESLARQLSESEDEVARLKEELADAKVDVDARAALRHCQASRRAMAEHEEAHNVEITQLKGELAEAKNGRDGQVALFKEIDYWRTKCAIAEDKLSTARTSALKEAEAIARRHTICVDWTERDGYSPCSEKIADAIAALATEVRPSASHQDGATPLPGAGGEEDRALVEDFPFDMGAKVESVWRDICELPDRTSPEDHPGMALLSFEEFRGAVGEVLAEVATPPAPDPRDAKIASLTEVAKMVDAWGHGIRHSTAHEIKMVKAARAALGDGR